MWDWFINLLTVILQGIQNVVGDWGLAVIILTVIIRILLTPLMTKQVKSTAGMQVMQPRLQEIQEKYADDPVRQQEETMKVYSEMKFNPIMGCLPIFLQMPIFFGLFSVVKNVPTDACFYGILPSISDSVANVVASAGWVGAAAYIFFDILFGVLTFVPMLLNTSLQNNEQKMQSITMGAVMAIMMVWFGWSVPAAVLLYYNASAIWQVVQQKFITSKVLEKAKAEAEEAAAKKGVEVDVVRKEKKPRPRKKN